MALTLQILDPEKLLVYLSREGDTLTTGEEALIAEFEEMGISTLEGETLRRFLAPEPMVRYYDGNGGPRLYLRWHATQIDKIEQGSGLGWTEINPSNYFLHPNGMSAFGANGVVFPEGKDNIRVTGDFGYEAADVPMVAKQFLYEYINFMWRGRSVATTGDAPSPVSIRGYKGMVAKLKAGLYA